MIKFNSKNCLYSLALIFFLFNSIFFVSSAYYADVDIVLRNNGNVYIEGISNHPMLKNGVYSDLLFKKNDFWIFNLTLEGKFDQFVYDLTFPRDSVINYLNIPNNLGFTQKSEGITVFGYDSGNSVSLIAQYSFEGKDSFFGFSWYFYLILFILIVFLIFYLRKVKSHKKYKLDLNFDFDTLNPRQKDIMNLILENKGKIKQSDLQKKIDFPKSSLSRNINSLERKGLIKKISDGKSNLILINKKKE